MKFFLLLPLKKEWLILSLDQKSREEDEQSTNAFKNIEEY